MDELSPLFQEIEFHERYRGYDPDEVDAFVDRVARAAAVMRGRITELHERAEAAEARGGGAATHSDAEETLTRTLVLAQRTADAAIAEARAEADRLTADAATSAQAILSGSEAEAQLTLREAQAEAAATLKDAEERASRALAEAETDRRLMVAEAESVAAEAAGAERERLAAEVAELHEYRAFLADDIEILERHLTEERHQLTASVAALADLLESPEAFRVARPPATSGVHLDPETIQPAAEVDIEAEADVPAADEAAAPEPVVAETETATTEQDTSDHDIAGQDVAEHDGEPGHETIDLVAAEAAGHARDPEDADVADADADVDVVVDEAEVIDVAAQDDDPGSGGEPAYAGMPEHHVAEHHVAEHHVAEHHVAEPRAAEGGVEPAPPRLVTAADLEETSATAGRLGFESSTFAPPEDDGGPVTEAVPALQDATLFADPEEDDDDPFLSQLRDAMDGEPLPAGDDEALTAFFDQEEDDGSRSWFGRRR